MSEEEKEAIEELIKKATFCDYELREYPNMICFKKDVITVLNLIERQKEEKDLLTKMNKKLIDESISKNVIEKILEKTEITNYNDLVKMALEIKDLVESEE